MLSKETRAALKVYTEQYIQLIYGQCNVFCESVQISHLHIENILNP